MRGLGGPREDYQSLGFHCWPHSFGAWHWP